MFILKNEVIMSSVLLNTLGAGKDYSHISSVSVSNPPPSLKNDSIPEQTKNNKTGADKMLTAGLAGLGVLGVAFVAVKGVKVYNNKKFTKEIYDLKNVIRDKYLLAKNNVIEEFNNQDFPESFNINGSSKVTISSLQGLKPIREYYRNDYEKFSQLEKDAILSIKSTLAKLSQDDEWKSLRRLRKTLLKDIDGNNENKRKIAYKKIALVNDLLSYKVHPESEQVFQSRNLINIDDARYMVNKDFVDLSEYETELAKRIKFGFEYAEMDDFFVNDGKLFLANLFPHEVQTVETAANKVKLTKIILEDEIKPYEETLSAKLHELAKKFRTEKEVLKLKKLTASKRSA